VVIISSFQETTGEVYTMGNYLSAPITAKRTEWGR